MLETSMRGHRPLRRLRLAARAMPCAPRDLYRTGRAVLSAFELELLTELGGNAITGVSAGQVAARCKRKVIASRLFRVGRIGTTCAPTRMDKRLHDSACLRFACEILTA